jgi:integrase
LLTCGHFSILNGFAGTQIDIGRTLFATVLPVRAIFNQLDIIDRAYLSTSSTPITRRHTRLRRGELIPLLWSDIDLQAKTIDVNKSVEIINGKSVQKDGEASIRTIDIPQQLVDFLSFERKKDGITPATETLWLCAR